MFATQGLRRVILAGVVISIFVITLPAMGPGRSQAAIKQIVPDRFNQLTFAMIRNQPVSPDPIAALPGADNPLAEGRILIYRTDEGRFGKLQILDCNAPLRVRYVTYNGDGTVFSQKDSLMIRDNVDLDRGQAEGSSDLWWQWQEADSRVLHPENNARFALYAAGQDHLQKAGLQPVKVRFQQVVVPKKKPLPMATATVIQPAWMIPGLVMGLRHNMEQEKVGPERYMVFFSARADLPVQHLAGDDRHAPNHRGYEWWMIKDNVKSAGRPLPPGLVLALKHSINQSDKVITAAGEDPCHGPAIHRGWTKQFGGDFGAPGGQGYYWYESSGAGFSDWRTTEQLPRWTVMGLKHSINQKNKKAVWRGRVYDAADRSGPVPPGFVRCYGGDRSGNTSHGQGYYWFEKTTGPELIEKPRLRYRLPQQLMAAGGQSTQQDRDRDGLNDVMEGRLADAFRPYMIFDSAEQYRRPFEPVTLFQVRPVNLRARQKRVRIKWVFLFLKDGGYGPNSKEGSNSHPGDNDDATFEMASTDNGLTWQLIGVHVSFKGIRWPQAYRMYVYDLRHPVIYVSAHKHHEYLSRDNDHDDSLYSDWNMNDDVDGRGARVLVDLRSLAAHPQYFNNVGEPEHHPANFFVHALKPFYPGYSAWGPKGFYDVGPISGKWMKHPVTR